MYIKENDVWNYVKKLCIQNKINPYDAYVFILDHITKKEKLLGRSLMPFEVINEIKQALIYLIS